MIRRNGNDKSFTRGLHMDLSKLTVDDFSNRIGDEFRIRVDDQSTVTLELDSAETRAEAGKSGRTDSAFSLLFRGPSDNMLPQGTYEFAHSDMGMLLIFIVPVRQDEKGYHYEAVFTRLDAGS